MPDFSVATVFGEEIEKQWAGKVPRECVFQLRLMGEQMMEMDKAIKTQQKMIEKLMQFAVLEGNALKALEAMKKDFQRRFGETVLNTEDVDGDPS